MSGTTDDIKGKAKEAVGDLTGDEALQREGKLDQASATVKHKVEDVKEWVEEKVDEVKGKLSHEG